MIRPPTPKEPSALKQWWDRAQTLRFVLGAVATLVTAGWVASQYLQQFATREYVREHQTAHTQQHDRHDRHHEGVERELHDLRQDVTRVQTVQTRMERTQDRVEDKLDQLILRTGDRELVRWLRQNRGDPAPEPPLDESAPPR